MNPTIKTERRARAVRGSCRGVTLVELMIAISVLLITVAGALSSEIASQRLLVTSTETSTAMTDLQACMEKLQLLAIEDIPVAGSEFAADQPVVAFEALHLTDERIVASYPDYVAGQPVPDPLEIVLTLTWTDHQRRGRSLQLASMKTR